MLSGGFWSFPCLGCNFFLPCSPPSVSQGCPTAPATTCSKCFLMVLHRGLATLYSWDLTAFFFCTSHLMVSQVCFLSSKLYQRFKQSIWSPVLPLFSAVSYPADCCHASPQPWDQTPREPVPNYSPGETGLSIQRQSLFSNTFFFL